MKPIHSESDVVEWFFENYKRLGFKRILKHRWSGTPDFDMFDKKNRVLKVEIEDLTDCFNHNPSDVDIVVCVYDNIGLSKIHPSIKVIELRKLGYLMMPDMEEHYRHKGEKV